MITREDLIQELLRRGVDPNQIPQPQAPAPQPQEIPRDNRLGYGNWGAWPGHENIEQWPKPGWVGRNIPAIMGGTAGGLGTAIGGPALGIGLAALAGAAGKAMQQETRQARGEEIPYGQMFKEQGKSALWEGGTEAVIPVAGKVIKKAAAPLAKKVLPKAWKLSQRLADAGSRIPEGELTKEAAEHLTKTRVLPTAAQQTQAPLLDVAENLTEGSIIGGGGLFTLKKILQPKALKVAAKELSEKFWQRAGKRLTQFDVGKEFITSILDKKTAARKVIGELFGQVDDAMKGMGNVELFRTKQLASGLFDEAAMSKGLGSSSGISRVAKKVMALDDMVDFRTAQAIRSNLLEEVRKLEGVLNTKLPKVDRVTKMLSEQIDSAMEIAATKHSPEAYALWRRANKANKMLYKDVLSNDFINAAYKYAEKNPEEISKYLFNSAETAIAAKKIMPTSTWDSLVASKMDDLIKTSMKPVAGDIAEETGVVWGRTFLKHFDELGPEVQKAMFSPAHIEHIREFGQMARLVQDPIGRGGGGLIIALVQAGAIVSTLMGKYTPQSAGVLLGPEAISRLLTSPTGIKWLTIGLKTPAVSPVAGTILVRIMREAGMPESTYKPPAPKIDYNPFKNFPGPPRLTPKGGFFGGMETKQQQQTNLLLKTTR